MRIVVTATLVVSCLGQIPGSAAAQDRQFGSWMQALQEIAGEGGVASLDRVPDAVQGWANSRCGYSMPDSVALVSGGPDHTGRTPSIVVSSPTGGGQPRGERILPPLAPDTLRMHLLEVKCVVLPEGNAFVWAMERDGRVVFYTRCAGCEDYPLLRFVEPDGSLSVITYSAEAKATGTVKSIARAQEEAKARRASEARAAAARARAELAARTAELKKKGWSQRAIEAVLAGRVYLGMTPEMVLESWGEPNHVNRTVAAYGVHEQWVYADQYVYFENGKLTTIQTTR